MSWALGVELAPDAVRIATMSTAGQLDEPVEVHPPVLFSAADATWAGRDAIEQGAGHAEGFVEDVVDQFTVDRLFLTAGRLLTPDQALRELVWGIVCRPARVRQSWPDAVTVSCPARWDPAALARADALVLGLGLARARTTAGLDAASAAADALSRLPVDTVPIAAAVDLPDLRSDHAAPVVPVAPEAPVVPRPSEAGSSRVALIASVLAVVALVAALGVVVVLRSRGTPEVPRPAAPPRAIIPDPPEPSVAPTR